MKTAPAPPQGGARLPLGAHPKNTGGKKGRSGRKPKKWGTFLKSLRESVPVHEAVERAAKDETSRGFQPVLKLLADYDTEKPAEKHAIVGPLEVRVRFIEEGRKVTAS